ncbi:MAG: RHS repeat-associated core domain-containing protein, partial [Aestuariivirga sp.]|nr:RHS repeat-associated core domain-containing protein [Aestuariivirga sp.]
VWQASYDPFGQPASVTGTVEQNLRFPGQYFLIESGMAYNWHRIYDPATGRMVATAAEPAEHCCGAPSRRTALFVSNTSCAGHQNRSSPEAEPVMVRMVWTFCASPFSMPSMRLVVSALFASSEAVSVMLLGAITTPCELPATGGSPVHGRGSATRPYLETPVTAESRSLATALPKGPLRERLNP